MAEQKTWQVYIARTETLGGRALRRQLSLSGDFYKVLEENFPEEQQKEPSAKGLLLPFLEISKEKQEDFLPQVELALQKARSFHRTVLMLREPLTEILKLIRQHQQQGLSCTAVCTGRGELYGGEKPEEISGPIEEVLDLIAERLQSTSPKKRVPLPYREDAALRPLFVGELAGAALFALRRYAGTDFLLVKGQPCKYGEIAELAGGATGFAGKFQFGKTRLKVDDLPAGFRTMEANHPYQLDEVLAYLARRRQRQGRFLLSACVIMRDSEKEIGRCLNSLSAADEIIVVDTGSVDKSVEIAQQYTDKIYHFDWINDFAAAKNYALDQATGDWIVFPDSDEFFTEETAPNLHHIVEDYDGPGRTRHLFVRRKELDQNLSPINFEGIASRFFSTGSRFLGAVHETLITSEKKEPAGLILPRERCLLMHTGYDPSRVHAKLERNMKILQSAQAAGNAIPLHHYNMGKMLFLQDKYEAARAEMILAHQSENQPTSLKAEIYRIWYRASHKLGDEKAMAEAMAAMRQEMPNMPDSYLIEGKKRLDEGKHDEAISLLIKALELSHDFKRLNPAETNDIADELPAVAEALIKLYEQKGEHEQATRIRALI